MLHFAALFGIAFTLALACKRTFEQTLPVTVLAALLLLTLLAMIRRLLWVDALAVLTLVGVAAFWCYSFLTRRITPKEWLRRFGTHVLTPGLLCFALLAAFFWYAAEPMVAWWRDDLFHWALSPKSLWIFQGFVDGAHHLDPAFGGYAPGLSALQWWAMHALGAWRESTLYFVLFMSYVTFLLPLTSRLSWKRVWLLPLVCIGLIALPQWGCVAAYSFLGVDTVLALCFGYTLCQISRSQNGETFEWVSVALGLCGLVLLKQIGLFFVVFCAVVLGWRRRFGKKEWLCLLPPLLVAGGWFAYCRAMGLTGMHTSGLASSLRAFVQGTFVLPQGAEGLGEALWYSLSTPYVDGASSYAAFVYGASPLVAVPLLVWLALIPVGLRLLAKVEGYAYLRRAAWLFLAATALYLLLQYLGFFTVFYHEVSVYVGAQKSHMVFLLARYLTPLVLGVGMWLLALFIDVFPQRLDDLGQKLSRAFAVACIGLSLFSVNWGGLLANLLPERYIQHDRALGVEAEAQMDHDWAFALEGVENAHVLVGLEMNSDYIKNLRYAFAPTRFELPQASFLQSADALRDYLIQRQITHVICLSDASELYAQASQLVEEGEELYPWSLYEVVATDTGVALRQYD